MTALTKSSIDLSRTFTSRIAPKILLRCPNRNAGFFPFPYP